MSVALGDLLDLIRPGGGQGYSGGGGGGGGGGDEGEVVWFLLRLWLEFAIRYPKIGIPVTVVGAAVIFGWVKLKERRRLRVWDSPATAPRRRAVDLDELRKSDPEFSVVLFEDFVNALYARAQAARHDRAAMDALAPFLAPAARESLLGRKPPGVPVRATVIGAVVPTALEWNRQAAGGRREHQLLLDIEANLVLQADGAADANRYVREQWRLLRDTGAHSRPPEAVGTFGCPSCGAPFTHGGRGRCGQCGQVVLGGRLEWCVVATAVMREQDRPSVLTGVVHEQGNDFPTIFHPRCQEQLEALARDDPAFGVDALAARVRLLHAELTAAWNAQDLARLRPFVTDGLHGSLAYWIGAYRAQGLVNLLEEASVTEVVPCKVVRDKRFDAVTCRVRATGRDVTLDAAGKVVSGSRRRMRPYSEYLTLVRGATVRGAPRVDKSCPNCSGPLQVNQAGNCDFCGSHVTRGEFDWVLSKIEQDDSYAG